MSQRSALSKFIAFIDEDNTGRKKAEMIANVTSARLVSVRGRVVAERPPGLAGKKAHMLADVAARPRPCGHFTHENIPRSAQ